MLYLQTMYPVIKLKDIISGDVVGYIFQGEPIPNTSPRENYKVALSRAFCDEHKISEMWDLDNFDGFYDGEREVVMRSGKYALIENAIRLESMKNVDFEKMEDGSWCVYGYMFQPYSFVEFNNTVALQRALGRVDVETPEEVLADLLSQK